MVVYYSHSGVCLQTVPRGFARLCCPFSPTSPSGRGEEEGLTAAIVARRACPLPAPLGGPLRLHEYAVAPTSVLTTVAVTDAAARATCGEAIPAAVCAPLPAGSTGGSRNASVTVQPGAEKGG